MKVRLVREAFAGLDEVVSFAEKIHGERKAASLFEAILDRCDRLALQPYAGQVVHLAGFAPYRQLIVEELTIILYRIEGEEVIIHKIFDARTDWKR